MDSLLANYTSSDDEEDRNRPSPPSVSGHNPPRSASSPAASLFSSLPQLKELPKPAFSSIPKPQNPPPSKPLSASEGDGADLPNPRSKLFFSLPQPKQTQDAGQYPPKRVVQIRPQINLRGNAVDDEDDDEDEGEKEKKRKRDAQSSAQNTSVHSFLSSLPAARSSATLGAGTQPAGSGRRSVIDTDAIGTSSSGSLVGVSQSGSEPNSENHSTHVSYDLDGSINPPVGTDQTNVEYESYYGSYADHSWSAYVGYDSGYGDYYHPANDQSASGGSNSSYGGSSAEYGNGSVASDIKVSGKRGRNEIPKEIVEVKQDELMKNRPREDQMKMTGIAFGPSHQPVSSAKGKPNKLHKRKHQIGSLYFDMKQKEMELAERRARGFLTKAQTQGKYGW